MHYGFDGYWSQLWWTDHERQMYKSIVSQYNTVATFVGHTHVCMMYEWEGLTIINTPSSCRVRQLPRKKETIFMS